MQNTTYETIDVDDDNRTAPRRRSWRFPSLCQLLFGIIALALVALLITTAVLAFLAYFGQNELAEAVVTGLMVRIGATRSSQLYVTSGGAGVAAADALSLAMAANLTGAGMTRITAALNVAPGASGAYKYEVTLESANPLAVWARIDLLVTSYNATQHALVPAAGSPYTLCRNVTSALCAGQGMLAAPLPPADALYAFRVTAGSGGDYLLFVQ